VIDRLRGLIRRRILVNFRVDPEVLRRLLPDGFEPKLVRGHAIAGICLIRLEDMRPTWLPTPLGRSSENAAHRMAALRRDDRGGREDCVYIIRRDSGSSLNRLMGGRLFPGEHNAASFVVRDDGRSIDLDMFAADGAVVELRAHATSALPSGSAFPSLDDASSFFRGGSLGYSVTRKGSHLDALHLDSTVWRVEPLAVDHVRSTFFEDAARFPSGSVELDCALIMRGITHEWRRGVALGLRQNDRVR